MKFYVYIIFLLTFSCTTFRELTLDSKTEIPDFIKKPDKYITYINLSDENLISQQNKNLENLINEKIIIQLEQIEIVSDQISRQELDDYYNSTSLLINYLLSKIVDKNPHIEFVNLQSQSLKVHPTHILKIEVIPVKKSRDVNFNKQESLIQALDLEFKISRIKQDAINYNLICKCIEIKGENQNKIHIKQPDGILIPKHDPYYFTVNFHELENFINKFQSLGMGYINILSSSKSEIIIENDKRQIQYKGFTPAKIQLLEGQYKIYSINKNNNYKKEELLVLREKEDKNIVLRWDDEKTSSFLNVLSNENLDVILNDEYRGFTPIFISEVYQGSYNIQLLQPINEKSKDRKLLFVRDLFLQENQQLNLFYPINYYINFNVLNEDYTKFWFAGKNNTKLKKDHINQNGLLIKQNQEIFSADILLDELRGEISLSCLKCSIIFYFEKDLLILKKIGDFLILYQGKDILKKEKVYQFDNNNLHVYFDQNDNNKFYLYINTKKILESSFDSNYVTVSIKGDEDTILKEFYINEKGYNNFLLKSLYFLRKKLSNIFDNQYKIR